MVVSALVLLLSPEPDAAARARATLLADHRIMIGDAVRDRLPLVTETESADEGAALVDTLAELAGVMRVDVVAIDFGEDA